MNESSQIIRDAGAALGLRQPAIVSREYAASVVAAVKAIVDRVDTLTIERDRIKAELKLRGIE